jgi:hypothetical protein
MVLPLVAAEVVRILLAQVLPLVAAEVVRILLAQVLPGLAPADHPARAALQRAPTAAMMAQAVVLAVVAEAMLYASDPVVAVDLL